MKHTGNVAHDMKSKIFLYTSPVLIVILILLSLMQTHVESKSYYCLNGEIWNWTIMLSEDNDFNLYNNSLSFFPIEDVTKQYYYKDDMLILEYYNGMTLYFKVDLTKDTLMFQKNLSYYPYELAKEVWGAELPLRDGSVFERYYYPEE